MPSLSWGWGLLRGSCRRLLAAGVLQGCSPERRVASLPGSQGGPESPEKPGLAVSCLFFPLPGRLQELGNCGAPTTPLRGDRDSLLGAPFLSRDSNPRWVRRSLHSSPGCPALVGPRANLGSSRASLARLGFKHLLLGSLAPRLRAGGAAASAALSWRRGADAPGSSSLHFNSWPLWPLHTERETGVGRVGDTLHRCARVCGLVGEMWSRNTVFMWGHVQINVRALQVVRWAAEGVSPGAVWTFEKMCGWAVRH